MNIQITLAAFALAVSALPASAQIQPRGGDSRTGSTRDRAGTIGTVEAAIEAARRAGTRDGGVYDGRTSSRGSSRVPPGHLPPRGACRVWIDGVPPGQQPPVTSCAQAERDRFRYGAGARVIYGDVQSFPGKGKGKFKNRTDDRRCSIVDGVVINGRVENVCRDDSVHGSRARDGRWDDDEDSDRGNKGLQKAAKARGKAAAKGGRKGRG
jgi:hypothetical protein